MEIELCPDCCIELKKISKQIDKSERRIHLQCPKCGFIKRPKSIFEQNKELDDFREIHHLDKCTTYRTNLNAILNK